MYIDEGTNKLFKNQNQIKSKNKFWITFGIFIHEPQGLSGAGGGELEVSWDERMD
jgi:hypothetical protein